ncbi:MAG: TRAP transporter small permease subunit [Alphaproteobacteria bacterium]|nr:TRAP transporter small permease subunit [Alphaproteobacteria bacterium]
MSSMFEGVVAILSAFVSMDAFVISEALGHPAAYIVGLFAVLVGGYLIMLLLRAVPLLDRHLERSVLIVTYLIISTIIFVEVIRRFVFQVQAPWSTTIPPYLFLIMTWVGCAYNTKLRSHLSFSELRANLGRKGQLACLTLDAVLWLTFALIVVVTTTKQTANSAANFQILLGTDNVMQWWFYACVPISWMILSARAIENLFEDFAKYRSGKPLVEMNAIGGGD